MAGVACGRIAVVAAVLDRGIDNLDERDGVDVDLRCSRQFYRQRVAGVQSGLNNSSAGSIMQGHAERPGVDHTGVLVDLGETVAVYHLRRTRGREARARVGLCVGCVL